jgi:flagellar protein FlbB
VVGMEREDQEKKSHLFHWIFYGTLIPLLFGIVVLVAVLSISGINVLEEGKKWLGNLPVVGKMAGGDERDSQYEKRIAELEGKLRQEEEEKESLQKDIDRLEKEIENLTRENEKLQREKENLEKENEQNASVQKGPDVVRTYEKMAPKKAAAIFAAMDEKRAVSILSQLKEENLARILEKMSPQDAAKFTSLLSETE